MPLTSPVAPKSQTLTCLCRSPFYSGEQPPLPSEGHGNLLSGYLGQGYFLPVLCLTDLRNTENNGLENLRNGLIRETSEDRYLVSSLKTDRGRPVSVVRTVPSLLGLSNKHLSNSCLRTGFWSQFP